MRCIHVDDSYREPTNNLSRIGISHKTLLGFSGLDIRDERIDISRSSMRYYRVWLVSPRNAFHSVFEALSKMFPGRVEHRANAEQDFGMFMVSVEFSAQMFWSQVNTITFPQLIEQTSVSFAKDILEKVGRR